MLFLILLTTSLGVWATIDMLSPDEKSDSSDDENASEANETTQAESQTSSSSNNSAMSSQNLQLANQSTNTTTTETSASTFNFVDEGLGSTDDFVRLDDQDNAVGYYDFLTKNYADMRGDDTILGGSEEDLIIDVSGANSISGGAGNDYIFSIESDAARFDGSDTVNGGAGDDLLFFDDGDTATGGDGRDAFVTYANPYDPNYEPVQITDFDRNDDTIEIGVFTFNPSVPIDQNRLDTEWDIDARQTLIYVDDDVVAKLDGLFVGIDDRITLTPLQNIGQHSLDQVSLGS